VMDEQRPLFMESENYALVDALPYIDTQLGQAEVAQQVKALIDEEMAHFEARDYLASLPAPTLPYLESAIMAEELARVEAGKPLAGIDVSKYKVEAPQGNNAQDHGSWRKAADGIHVQLEYNRLRLVNLELLERWGKKAWVAHSATVRSAERVLTNEATTVKAARENVNKKRKLEQISCGNELRKLSYELEQYQLDNLEVEKGLHTLEAEVQRLRQAALERNVDIADLDRRAGLDTETAEAAAAETSETAAAPESGEASGAAKGSGD